MCLRGFAALPLRKHQRVSSRPLEAAPRHHVKYLEQETASLLDGKWNLRKGAPGASRHSPDLANGKVPLLSIPGAPQTRPEERGRLSTPACVARLEKRFSVERGAAGQENR